MGFERGGWCKIGGFALAAAGLLAAWLLWTAAATAGPVRLGGFAISGCLVGPSSSEACAGTAPGLAGPVGIVVSPDNKDVYVAQPESGTVVFFRRDTQTGALRPNGCIEEPGAGAGCGNVSFGLGAPVQLSASRDGRNVYVASPQARTLSVLARDPASGRLRSASCIRNATAPGPCAPAASPFDAPATIAVSLDDRHVYVSAVRSDDITVFARLPNGALSDQGCISDLDVAKGLCPTSAGGLSNVTSMAVSGDGRNVYAAGEFSLVTLTRNSQTGALAPADCIAGTRWQVSCGRTNPVIGERGVLTIAPDGLSVYLVSADGNAILALTRDPNTGRVTPVDCIETSGGRDCNRTAAGLVYPVDVAMTPDGRRLFVASQVSNALVTLRRGSDGTISPDGCVQRTYGEDCPVHADGLTSPDALAMAPDGRNFYMTSMSGSTLSVFTAPRRQPRRALRRRGRHNRHRARHRATHAAPKRSSRR